MQMNLRAVGPSGGSRVGTVRPRLGPGQGLTSGWGASPTQHNEALNRIVRRDWVPERERETQKDSENERERGERDREGERETERDRERVFEVTQQDKKS